MVLVPCNPSCNIPHFDKIEEEVLALGLNFAITPKAIPTQEIVTRTEAISRTMNANQAQDLKSRVKWCLKHCKQPKTNLTRQQLKAIQRLKGDESIKILPADKGRTTVILDSTEYHQKMEGLLQDGTYKKLKNDPTLKITKGLNQMLRKLEDKHLMDRNTRLKLAPSQNRPPQMYGLPKIHKPDRPMRPIVSSIGSPTYYLAKELTRILSPLVGNSPHHITNSSQFAQLIAGTSVGESDKMVSFDVKSLFTKVPVKEAVSRISSLLDRDTTLGERTNLPPRVIIEMIEKVFSTTYFQLGTDFYEQTEGAAMGSPLSPVLANLYMEFFEEMAIDTATHKPTLWIRYVDDTFVIWTHGDSELQAFLGHLNSLRESIQFTMEEEEQGQLPFLDVLVKRKGSNLTTSVYRKPTSTDGYLNYQSNHHPAIKLGTITCLRKRAHNICSQENLQEELQHLQSVFEKNGYPRTIIQRVLRKQKSTEADPSNEDKKILSLPYIRGLSENLQRTCRPLGITVVHKSNSTLRCILMKVKTPISRDQAKGVIYRIPCECGQEYIGETSKSIHERIAEHRRSVRRGDTNNSIAVHVQTTDHIIKWENAEVLQREQHKTRRKIKEAMYIQTSRCMNLDQGMSLDPIWNDIIPSINTNN